MDNSVGIIHLTLQGLPNALLVFTPTGNALVFLHIIGEHILPLPLRWADIFYYPSPGEGVEFIYFLPPPPPPQIHHPPVVEEYLVQYLHVTT